jgi:hypothetical protein
MNNLHRITIPFHLLEPYQCVELVRYLIYLKKSYFLITQTHTAAFTSCRFRFESKVNSIFSFHLPADVRNKKAKRIVSDCIILSWKA